MINLTQFNGHFTSRQVFAGLVSREHNADVESNNEKLVLIRRQQLAKWMAEKDNVPKYQAEKSYFSQLAGKGASAPFGEKAARRIERSYGMPTGYLDGHTEDSGTLIPLSREYISKREEEIIQFYRRVPPTAQQEIFTYAVTQFIKSNPNALTERLDSIAPHRTAALFGRPQNADDKNNQSSGAKHGSRSGRVAADGKGRKT